MVLFRYACLLTTLLFVSVIGSNAQVTFTPSTDDACQSVVKSISPITITEQLVDDFALTTSVGETLIFEPTSGTLTADAGSVSFTTNDVDAQIVVTASQVTVTLTAATGNHSSNIDALTISGLQITSSIQENIELRFKSLGTAVVNGLSPETVVAYVTFHPPADGSPDNISICPGESVNYNLQANVPVSSTFTWSTAGNAAVTGGGGGSATTINDILYHEEGTPQVVTYDVMATSDYGCTGSMFQINVTVNPMPKGANRLLDACSQAGFVQDPQDIVTTYGNGTSESTYEWTANAPDEITGSALEGSGVINELLVNTTTNQHAMVYTVTGTTSSGCVGPAFNLTVHVNPLPAITGQTTFCTSGILQGTYSATYPSGTFVWDNTEAITPDAGGLTNDDFVTLTWPATPTDAEVSVTYTNIFGCAGEAILQVNISNSNPTGASDVDVVCSNTPNDFDPQSTIDNLGNSIPAIAFQWIAADNATTTGESLSLQSTSKINDAVTNTQSTPEVVVYTITPLGACGAGSPFTVAVTVKPEPVTSGGNTAICVGNPINFDLTSRVTNAVPTDFSWIAVDNPHTFGESHSNAVNSSTLTDTPGLSENYTSEVVVYTITPTATDGACEGAPFTVNATIQKAPSAPSQIASVCSGGTASVDLQANVNAVGGNSVPSTFTWIASSDAPNITGESLVSQNTGVINNLLSVSGVPKQTVTYNVTPTSSIASCTGAVFTVAVEVNEGPQAPASSETLCSGVAQSFDINAHYVAGGSLVPASSFSWVAADNANVTGETLALQSTASINDGITNPTNAGENVVYTITAVALNGCAGTFTRTVTINPLPTTIITNAAPIISSMGSTNITLGSSVAGATFSYVASAPSEISGASDGTVSPIAQVLTNSNTLQHIVTYTITASANGCSGLAAVATLTVRGDPTMNQNDSLALVALYNAVGGANWTTQTNWMTGPANAWHGVTVSSERLVGLALPGNNLTGSLPVAFFNAPLLNLLDLRNNAINGTLPSEISNFTALQLLNLQNNQMDGPLPNSLFSLTNLTQLYLRGNDFTGSIPSVVSNLTSLQTLQAEGLPMSGPIPPEVFGLTSLVNLGLSGKINGPLPASIGSLTSLLTFSCDSCDITSLPAGITNLANLTSLRLQNNRMENLPNLSSLPLTYLDVSKNSLTFESLEPHTSVPTFVYAPQDTVGIPKSVLLQTTTSHTFTANVGGSANQYAWRKNNVVIPSATSATYTIASPVFEDEGVYHSEVTSSLLPGLTLTTSPVNAKVSSLKRDSLTLLQVYTTTNGPGWTGVTGWPSGNLSTWSGVVITSNRVTGLDLAGKGLTGSLPADFTDLRSLQNANLSGNKLTSIPVISSMTNLTNLNVSSNSISFGSLEPNSSALGKITYSPQNVIGVVSRDSLVAGSPVELSAIASGDNNLYQWKRNNTNVSNATSSAFTIGAISRQNMGDYVCEITNSVVPNLVLRTATKTVLAVADLSGKVKINSTNFASKGTVTLLRVNPGSAFVKTKIKAISADGSYSFKKVVLDDYQILAFADTVSHVGALPTYYKNTLLWEEADTVFVDDHRVDLDITSQFKPGPASGRGHISGVVQEEEKPGSGGRTQLPKPVKQVGVSARRVQNTGRGQDEVLTLMAYVFTNDQGEFSLANLPTGNYRLNIQYPGYPMDEKSFINFTIGTGLQEEVKVEALVDKGVINVRQLIITGAWSKENYAAHVFPNPTSSFITLKFETSSSYRDVGIFDITGKEIQHIPAPDDNVEINVSDFSKGIYLINVSEKGSLVKSLHVIIE